MPAAAPPNGGGGLCSIHSFDERSIPIATDDPGTVATKQIVRSNIRPGIVRATKEQCMAADYGRIHRLLRVLTLIQGEKGWNAKRLAAECDTTERNIYRDLKMLTGA